MVGTRGTDGRTPRAPSLPQIAAPKSAPAAAMAALLRCTVCGEGLSEDDFHSSLCRFHVGNYASGAWRCCNAPGEAAPGCAAGCHVRNVDTQQAQQHASDGEHSDSDASGARPERDEGDAAAPPEPFVNVILGSSDTLAGIALRYNTTPEVRATPMMTPVSAASQPTRGALRR